MIDSNVKKKLALVSIVVIVIVASVILIPYVQRYYALRLLDPLKYKNYEMGIGLNPPQGWAVQEDFKIEPFSGRKAGFIRLYSSQNENDTYNASFYIYLAGPLLGEKVAENNYHQSLSLLINSTDKNYTLVSYGKRTINGMEAYEIIEETNYTNESKQKIQVIFLESKDIYVEISYSGSYELFDIYKSSVEESLDTLTIV